MQIKLPHVYIAGPFRAATPWLIEQNVRRAEEIALEVWRAGAVGVCPHLLSRHFQESLPDEVWLKGFISLLSTCDALLILPGWERSKGTQAEIAHATSIGLPVFFTLKDCAAWVKTCI